MERVWPDAFVEEINLTKNISTLRKTLRNGNGAGEFIETIPTIGYRFVAEVRQARNGGTVLERVGDATQEERETTKLQEEEPPVILPTPRPVPIDGRRRWLWGGMALLIAVLMGWVWLNSNRSPQIKSLAVLPLNSLEATQQDNALALRLADALILRLGSLRQLQVRPITAVRSAISPTAACSSCPPASCLAPGLGA